MRSHLTQKDVDAAKPATARYYLWDDEVDGLGVAVLPGGRKVFVMRYRYRKERRWDTIAQVVKDAYNLKNAKDAAGVILGKLANGVDPRAEAEAAAAMPTFKTWVEEYLETVAARKRRPYWDTYHLLGPRGRGGKSPVSSPAMARWADTPLDALDVRAVDAYVKHVADISGKITANRAYAALRSCLEAAVRAGILKDNACRFVKKFPENPPRQRVLTDAERTRLLEAIAHLPDPYERVLFLVLMESGCRQSEVLAAKWQDVDLDAGTWLIPSPKAGRPQVLPLAGSLVAALRTLKRRKLNPHVFPGRREGKPRTTVAGTWEALRGAAKLEGVTCHDLRRDYGLRVARKAGILAASRLLRHADTRITSRVYAPLGVEDLRSVTDGVSLAKVLPMPAAGGK